MPLYGAYLTIEEVLSFLQCFRNKKYEGLNFCSENGHVFEAIIWEFSHTIAHPCI